MRKRRRNRRAERQVLSGPYEVVAVAFDEIYGVVVDRIRRAGDDLQRAVRQTP
jgi:hypothetical protein